MVKIDVKASPGHPQMKKLRKEKKLIKNTLTRKGGKKKNPKGKSSKKIDKKIKNKIVKYRFIWM